MVFSLYHPIQILIPRAETAKVKTYALKQILHNSQAYIVRKSIISCDRCERLRITILDEIQRSTYRLHPNLFSILSLRDFTLQMQHFIVRILRPPRAFYPSLRMTGLYGGKFRLCLKIYFHLRSQFFGMFRGTLDHFEKACRFNMTDRWVEEAVNRQFKILRGALGSYI